MTDRLTPETERDLRFASLAKDCSLPGAVLREVLGELDAARAERDAAIQRANEVPGLTAALDEARWERDVAKGEQTAGGQALDEIERLRAELADIRARFEEKLREPITTLKLEGPDELIDALRQRNDARAVLDEVEAWAACAKIGEPIFSTRLDDLLAILKGETCNEMSKLIDGWHRETAQLKAIAGILGEVFGQLKPETDEGKRIVALFDSTLGEFFDGELPTPVKEAEERGRAAAAAEIRAYRESMFGHYVAETMTALEQAARIAESGSHLPKWPKETL